MLARLAGGGVERKPHPLRAMAFLAAQFTWLASNLIPLAFKCLTASTKDEKWVHSPPSSGRSHAGGGMG